MAKACYVELPNGLVLETDDPARWPEAKRLSAKEGRDRMRTEAIEHLRGLVEPGDTIYAILRHVSSSGMSRSIDLYAMHEGRPFCLSGWVRQALGYPEGKAQGIKVGGCGMDMGYHLVYNLSRALWPDGFGCTGEGCPSNDHSNGDRDYTPHGVRGPNYVPGERDTLRHLHKDGGYALKHSWL